MQRTSQLLSLLLLPAGLAACGGGSSCPLPRTAEHPEWADVNADGQVDVNDGVRIARHTLAGGPALACRGQGDLLGTGQVSIEAAAQIWDVLFVGTPGLAWPTWDDCAWPLAAAAPPGCADVELNVVAPADVTGPFEASVSLRASKLDPDAWSFGVRAKGCTVTSATLTGTAADHSHASPPGVVADGFALAQVVDGGAITAVVPSWLEPVALTGAGDGKTVLQMNVEATPPASGCAVCTLTVTGALNGAGRPVSAVVGSQGSSYAPKLGSVEVQVCGG